MGEGGRAGGLCFGGVFQHEIGKVRKQCVFLRCSYRVSARASQVSAGPCLAVHARRGISSRARGLLAFSNVKINRLDRLPQRQRADGRTPDDS